MELTVSLIEAFTHEQRGSITHPEAALSLTVSGLRYHKLPGYERSNTGPFLILAPPCMPVTFDFSAQRENWVILFESPGIKAGSRDGLVAVRAQAADPWIEIPYILDLEAEAVPALQRQFLDARQAFQSPLAVDRLRMHIGIMGLIGQCLRNAALPATQDPAAQLRRLIDGDLLGRHGLADLSRQCGMSVDHLRRCFQRTYGMAPLAYRQRQRLVEANKLLNSTDSPIAAISAQLGFRHASHFCAVFRAHFGRTPMATRRRFRLGV